MPRASVDVGNSVQTSLNTFFGYIPNIIGFLVILIVGYVIAKAVKAVVNKALRRLKVDQALTDSHAGGFVEKVSPGGRPSNIVGAVAFWLIFLYAITAAIGALKIPAVTAFMNEVLAYLPNVIAAVLIFVVASILATAVVTVVRRTMGDTPTGKVVEAVVPGLVMAIAAFMILTQLRIAPSIVIITYAALIGMLSLAGALAFGLGGRDVAARLLENAYQSGQQAAERTKSDVQTAKTRAQNQTGQDPYASEAPTVVSDTRAGAHRS
ncbi:MAG: CmpX protein [Frankiales bacterium]|jgi:hypothetical protein|nr:CmpX protein [Frankiales bacterium]